MWTPWRAAKLAWTSLRTSNCDLVLLDIWLPGMDGIQVLEKIQALESPPIVIMISGHGTIETAVRSTKLGPSISSKSRSPLIRLC